MRKSVLFGISLAITTASIGQNYDDAKAFLMMNNYKKAKELVDKGWEKPKYYSKPEAYILKATTYAGAASDSSLQSQSKQLLAEAEAALAKYQELDPKAELLTDKTAPYSNTPIIIYGNYFNEGIANYNKKNYDVALQNFDKALKMSDMIIEKKLADMKLDTNGLLLAGASAQAVKKDAEAEKYFTKLAEAKISGKDNEFIYNYIAAQRIQKGDIEGFNKFLKLGQEANPGSKTFDYDDVDYILQVEDPKVKEELISKKLASDPNNYKLQSIIGETIYEQLNGKDDNDVPKPANYDELEQKMVAAFKKAAELKPDNGFPMSNLGNHFISKSAVISKERDEFANYMKEKRQAAAAAAPKPKPGAKPAPIKEDAADSEKREDIRKRYNDAIAQASIYFEKATEIYGKLPSPTSMEKQQWKNAVSYLIDINGELKNANKGKPEYDKYEKEEKKWSAEYTKLSNK